MKINYLPILLAIGCASGPETRSTSAKGPAWPVAGARCQGAACICRGVGDGKSDKEDPGPPEGTKRFELRTGRGLDPTQVTIDGRPAVEKRLDLPDPSCVYIDLPPGKHTVALRATAKEPMQGFNPSLEVAEYGVATGRYYKTLTFLCGGTNGEPCLRDDVKAVFEEWQKIPRGLHDPCGSTRIEGAHWGAERSPESKLEDLQLEFTMHVYRFPPKLPPGSAECGKKHAKELEE
jgi:hypothetical protein